MKFYQIDNALLIRALAEANGKKRESSFFFKKIKHFLKKLIGRLEKKVYATA